MQSSSNQEIELSVEYSEPESRSLLREKTVDHLSDIVHEIAVGVETRAWLTKGLALFVQHNDCGKGLGLCSNPLERIWIGKPQNWGRARVAARSFHGVIAGLTI